VEKYISHSIWSTTSM